MPYQSHPASLVDLLDKLNKLSCQQGWWEQANRQMGRRTDACDDKNLSAEEAEG